MLCILPDHFTSQVIKSSTNLIFEVGVKYGAFSESLPLSQDCALQSLLCNPSLSKGETELPAKAPAWPAGKTSVLHVVFETPLTTWLQPVCPGIPQVVKSERRQGVREKRTGTV